MNSRRKILKFFGLGSLAGAASAASLTPNQSRADAGLPPLPQRTEVHVPHPTFGPYEKTKWDYQTVEVKWKDACDGAITRTLNKFAEHDEVQFVSMSFDPSYRAWLVFRKRVLDIA